jgi:hypothetical protein
VKVLNESGWYQKQQSSNRLYVDVILGFLAVLSILIIHIIVRSFLSIVRVVRENPW